MKIPGVKNPREVFELSFCDVVYGEGAWLAQLVERPTEKSGAILTQVRVPVAARDFIFSRAGFSTKWLSSTPTLSQVQLLHTSLSYFISTLLLAVFAQPRILGFTMFLGWAGGPWGRDHVNTSDL